MSLPLVLYAGLSGLLEPLAPLVLKARAGRGREDPARLGERLGRPGLPRPPGPLAWLHGVSVGESLSLIPLIEALRARRPDLTLLVTSGTATSASLLAKRLPDGVIHQYAPVDGPAAAARFLDHWKPGAVIFAESEFWPNLILGARRRGARLALLSARITQASADGWARVPASAREVLAAFDLILPQDAATEARLQRLGAITGPRLNLKLAGAPPPCDPAELARLKAAVGPRKVVLAASTHPGEEDLVARAMGGSGALLVIVPRHPARGPEIAADARRSAGDPLTPATGIYLADTLGELGLFLRLADVVVMGGAFLEGVGGHNPMEAARLGKPLVSGPHAFNNADIYEDLYTEVAAIEAGDEADLARHIAGLLANPMIARRMGEAALSYAERQGAALEHALTLLEPLLPA